MFVCMGTNIPQIELFLWVEAFYYVKNTTLGLELGLKNYAPN